MISSISPAFWGARMECVLSERPRITPVIPDGGGGGVVVQGFQMTGPQYKDKMRNYKSDRS